MKVLLVDQIAKVNYKYSYSLAQAVKEQGNEVLIVSDLKPEKERCSCQIMNQFNTDEKNVSKIEKLKNYIESYIAIEHEIRSGNYDVIHIQWLLFSPVDYFFLKKIKIHNNIKFVMTIHDILPFNKKFFDYRYHQKIYKLADNIIVQANNNVTRFDELFPSLAGKEVMIPHGHFLDYAEPISKEEARKKLGIPLDKIIFLFFGQIKKVKGIGVLLEAFSKIYREYPDVMLIIAGSIWKDDFSQYQEIIDKEGIQNSIRTDIRYIPDDEVKYYYSASDCCVLPYLDVYQSGVIQLCYAYHKPTVSTRIGAFKEVVIDGVTGFMCEPNDAADLARAMEKAIRNKDKLEQMGHEGNKYIAEKYSWTKIAEQVNQLYRE